MANITIIDTGYITATSVTGTQAPEIVNSGSAIELKAVNISYKSGGNVDASPIINNNTLPVVGFGSVTTGTITITGVLDVKDATDLDTLQDLNDLRRTYGIKLLYYNSTSDGYRDITDTLGDTHKDDVHKANNFGGTATPHLHVRVINVSVTQTAGSYVRYNLELVETA